MLVHRGSSNCQRRRQLTTMVVELQQQRAPATRSCGRQLQPLLQCVAQSSCSWRTAATPSCRGGVRRQLQRAFTSTWRAAPSGLHLANCSWRAAAPEGLQLLPLTPCST